MRRNVERGGEVYGELSILQNQPYVDPVGMRPIIQEVAMAAIPQAPQGYEGGLQASAAHRADYGAHGADSYLHVELERRMWRSRPDEVSRTNDATNHEDVEDAICAICLDAMNADSCVTLPCGHCFHVVCAQMSERHQILDKGCYQCAACRCEVSSLRVSFFASGQEVWRVDTSSTGGAAVTSTPFFNPSAPTFPTLGEEQQPVLLPSLPQTQHHTQHLLRPLPQPPLPLPLSPQSDVQEEAVQEAASAPSGTAPQQPSDQPPPLYREIHHYQLPPFQYFPHTPFSLSYWGQSERGGGGGVYRLPQAVWTLETLTTNDLLKSNMLLRKSIEEMLNVSHDAFALGLVCVCASSATTSSPSEALPAAHNICDKVTSVPCARPASASLDNTGLHLLLATDDTHTDTHTCNTCNACNRACTTKSAATNSSFSIHRGSARSPVILRSIITLAEPWRIDFESLVHNHQHIRPPRGWSRGQYMCYACTLVLFTGVIVIVFIVWGRYGYGTRPNSGSS